MPDRPHLAPVLRGPANPIQENIVARLERALEEARRGEYAGGVLIFERADAEELDWSVMGTPSTSRLVGMLELLKHQVINTWGLDSKEG